MKEKVNIYLNPLELPTSTLVVSTDLDRFWLPKHCHPWDHDSRVGILHFSPFSTISIVFFSQWSSRSRTNLDHPILIVRYIISATSGDRSRWSVYSLTFHCFFIENFVLHCWRRNQFVFILLGTGPLFLIWFQVLY